jgi:hypothetical protein
MPPEDMMRLMTGFVFAHVNSMGGRLDIPASAWESLAGKRVGVRFVLDPEQGVYSILTEVYDVGTTDR